MPETELQTLKWGIAHDACRGSDRWPQGAVPMGQAVRITLRVSPDVRGSVIGAELVVDEGAGCRVQGLAACPEGFSGDVVLQESPHVALYLFAVHLASGAVVAYVPRADGRATSGELVAVPEGWDPVFDPWPCDEAALKERPAGDAGLQAYVGGFQVTVYEPAFATPEWLAGAIMYQVFPDRFARGQAGPLKEGAASHLKMKRPVHLHDSWDDPVEVPKSGYDPVDFYGGTLAGVGEKLDYLASLGVEVLYLNPVFEARSNHRYDTADYEHIDPLLGTDEDFAQLVRAAGARGISIVLDGVFSHTGNDSRYFNALGSYAEPGAAAGAGSAYRSWYAFESDEPGAAYRCWWGDPSLPEVDERDPSWQRYILGTGCGDGILAKWLAAGARGWRLDVADEVPDDVLERIRTAVKAADPDAAIIGEVWEDATVKESYGERRSYALGRALDSVMNYPLRSALLGFALGDVDAYQLATFLKLQGANYPPPLHRCLMNLLSSHDVERVRSVLAHGAPLKGMSRAEQVKAVRSLTPAQDARGARLQRMVAGLMYALPGCPAIYYGDERGMHGGGDPYCRATFPWGEAGEAREDAGEDTTVFYRNLGRMRRDSAVLKGGGFSCMAYNDDVVCVLRSDAATGQMVLAVSNRAPFGCGVVLDLFAPELGLVPELRARILAAEDPRPFLSLEHGIASFVVAACSTRYFQID